MKFLIIFTIIIAIIELLTCKYRVTYHADPSYNPLRKSWIEGPRHHAPVVYSKKYINHNKAILTHHAYKDVTRRLTKRALRK